MTCVSGLVLLLALGCEHDLDLPRPGDSGADAPAAHDLRGEDLAADRLDAGGPDLHEQDLPMVDLPLADLSQAEMYVTKCPNNVLDPGEQCDGTKLNNKTCTDHGFYSGTLACTNKCVFDTSGCTNCGNDKVDTGEKCDGKDLNNQTCVTLKFDAGTLACAKGCTFDTSGCKMYKCGDGVIQPGEACDGVKLGGKTCISTGFEGGVLACAKDCKVLDTSGCYKCGDNKKNSTEQCDGTDLDNKSCISLGYYGGTLACTTGCKLNSKGCTNCGDGKVSIDEQCDGTKLNGKTCSSQGFHAGTLACKSDCKLDTSGCHNCGNGKLDSGEACDGVALGGKTCAGEGLSGGTLACKSSCLLDTSACSWLVAAGAKYEDCGRGIAVDPKGNTFVIGEFRGQVAFGGKTLLSQGMVDTFVAKLDPSGTFSWIAQAGGGSANTTGRSLALDSAGNIFAVGNFYGSTSFGSKSFNSSGAGWGFVTRLDSSGKFSWVNVITGSGHHGANDITVDSADQILVVGNFYGTATFLKQVLVPTGLEDTFVAKLDGSGKLIWIEQAGGTNRDYGSSIAVDGAGNSTIGGVFGDKPSFGSHVVKSNGQEDVYTARLNKLGKFQWATAAGGTGRDGGAYVALDGSGSSYLTGRFFATVDFGTVTLTSKGNEDLFVARLDSTGKFAWAVSAGGTGGTTASSIALNKQGHLLVTGATSGTATFGATTLTAAAPSDVFVARLDTSGKFLGATLGGLTSSSTYGHGHDITTDSAGNTYVTGAFTGQMTRGATTVTSAVGSPAKSDLFVWKLAKGKP